MHIAVIGAGAFGGWTAWRLLNEGAQVTLVDARGPGNSQSSSGGETRIIRSVYGEDTLSCGFAMRSLQLWKEHELRWNTRLYQRSGVLFFAGANDEFIAASSRALRDHNVAVELWSAAEAGRRYPQISFEGIDTVLFEPEAGILTARENCRTVLKHFVAGGGRFELASVSTQRPDGELNSLPLSNGSRLKADQFVFACGPWLGALFPDILAGVIRPTRQDVLFVATPPGDGRFSAVSLPCWADRTSEEKFYGIPDVQHRGFKLASDLRGPSFDPNATDRLIEARSWQKAKEYLRQRFPGIADAPLVETRVCQYENTPDLGLLIDRHPAAANVLLVGGGSGHGYKNGPAVGEYVAGLVRGTATAKPGFSLARFSSGAPQFRSSF